MGAIGFSTERGVTPDVRIGMMVSGNYFQVLGVEPQLGRGFREDEDMVPGRDAVVVLGPDFWKKELAGDPSVVGRTIRLNGHEFTVIGVAPESFTGMLVFFRPDFYMPLAMAPVFATNRQKNFFEDRDGKGLTLVGIGTAIGLAMGLAIERLMNSMLFIWVELTSWPTSPSPRRCFY
jgi:hypothetical protein